MSELAERVRFGPDGLVPAIVQDADSGRVLMLGYMNRESLLQTLSSGQVWFYSRSRQALWHKGETSGNTLSVRNVRVDCDGDALLVAANPAGPTCHTGRVSCFSGETGEPLTSAEVAADLFQVIRSRQRELPEGSYVASLFREGLDRIAKKLGEEATETVIAAKNMDSEELVREMADLWFHCLVLLAAAEIEPAQIWAELKQRRR